MIMNRTTKRNETKQNETQLKHTSTHIAAMVQRKK